MTKRGTPGQSIADSLVISEVAVSFLLLIGAGLLINSFVRLRHRRPWISSRKLIDDEDRLPETQNTGQTAPVALLSGANSSRGDFAGVASAAVANNLPLTSTEILSESQLKGAPTLRRTGADRDQPESLVPVTLRRCIPLLEGRDINRRR